MYRCLKTGMYPKLFSDCNSITHLLLKLIQWFAQSKPHFLRNQTWCSRCLTPSWSWRILLAEYPYQCLQTSLRRIAPSKSKRCNVHLCPEGVLSFRNRNHLVGILVKNRGFQLRFLSDLVYRLLPNVLSFKQWLVDILGP